MVEAWRPTTRFRPRSAGYVSHDVKSQQILVPCGVSLAARVRSGNVSSELPQAALVLVPGQFSSAAEQ